MNSSRFKQWFSLLKAGGNSFDRDLLDEEVKDSELIYSAKVIWVLISLVLIALVWSYFAPLAEVSTGTGKVIPSSREQTIQSLEGGIVSHLYVREGDVVEQGQILAQLDLTKTEATVEESASRYRAALAAVARLQAEVNEEKLLFPEELKNYPELIQLQTRLYNTRRNALKESLKGLQQSYDLIQQELAITKQLMQRGAASNIEVLKLERQAKELSLKMADRKAEYYVQAREELAKEQAEVEALVSVVRGREDSLQRLTMRSPVRGVVKDIEVTTQGGVIPPNGNLMAIVPLDEQLLIEARISPRDIAYIHPGQRALVKITAYEYSVYGGLEGEVVLISPDTIQDETKPDTFYYRVFIRTATDHLQYNGENYPIVPGMIATVDIRTGTKTVFDYLMKPVNLAKEAMRER